MSINTKIVAAIVAITAVMAFANDWPNWHGADRTNKSKETGLLKEWPKDGPKLLWTAKGLGEGYSGVAVARGVVYSAGVKNKANFVFAFDKNGKLLWERQIGGAFEAKRAHARQYSGARATPTINGSVVYYLSDIGILAALDAKSGIVKWQIDLPKKYEPDDRPMYGYSESPLIVGNRLYVAPYGSKNTAICVDKNSGAVRWESKNIGGGESDDTYAGYTSFVYFDRGGIKHIVSFTSQHIYALNAETGITLWTIPFSNSRKNNCTDIIYHDGHIFATSGYGRGSILLKLHSMNSNIAPQVVYDIKVMDNHHGGVIFHEGHVYGSGHESKGWFCLDLKTGAQKWNASGKGSLTFADGMLYLYDEGGTMTLASAASDKYTPISSFKVPEGGKGAYWAHPVVSHGVLYLRHADNLYAYAVK